ncbi:hypothetical protein BC937DRAFT_94059 [Endogone sp. FLAS-F59071]|nr:hypothetical protein BC937DRAFT_94059 [Endogone sp. FLAS-F59071]|eukprot:RUS14278.1 hypothetical protein BC937DRAFT_94059 [Endogone sp. FLAS-F59071]
MKTTLLLGALLLAPVIDAVCPEIQGYWCGKPYPRCILEETPPAVVQYNAPSWATQQVFIARSNLDQRSDSQPLEFMITPRLLPYMESDTVASLIIDIAHPHNHSDLHIASKPLFPATRLQSKPTQEVYFDITQLAPQRDPHIIQISIATTDETVIYQTTVTLYRLPPNPTDASVVRIDHLLGNIIPPNELSAPIFPYGSYVSGNWILGDSPAAIASLRDSKFKIANIVPGLPPYDYEPLDKVFQLAEEEGVWIQYDMRWSLTNLTLLEEQVERFKKYKNLLTWYTADEPDGTDWLNTTIAQTAYDLVKKLDPYHPVALVLNCLHASAEYASTTDIIMTIRSTIDTCIPFQLGNLKDVYPAGIDLAKCTPTDGVCGCDDCIGSISADIEARWETFSRDLASVQGKARVPQWMVLQG